MNEETRKPAMDAFGAEMPDDLAALGGIMDWCSDAVSLLDRDGVRLYQNPAHRKMFGGSDLLGSDSFAEIHPEDRERMRALFRKTIETGFGRSARYRTVLADGRTRHVESRSSAVKCAQGQVARVVVISRDVTARMTLEQLMDRERLRDSVALAVSGCCTWDYDIGRNLVTLSPSWGEIVGDPSAQTRVTFDSLYRMTHPEDTGSLNSALVEVLRGSRDRYAVEHRVRHSSGGWRWIVSRGSVTERDSSGRAKRMSGANLDITALKQAQANTQESEQRFREFAEVAADWFWETDAEDRYTFISANVEARGGVAPQTYLGKTRTEVALRGELQGEMAARWETHMEAIARREPFRDFVHQRSSLRGPQLWLRISGTPRLDAQGRFLGYRGVSTNITEQKRLEESMRRAEERLHTAIESLEDGFVLFDREDRLEICNRRYREMYAESADLLVPGARFEDIVREGVRRGQYPEAAGREQAWIDARLAAHREPDSTVVQQVAGGRWIRAAEQRTSDGGVVGLRIDVTELQKMQERQHETQKLEAIGQLTGGLAHDFNNLLGIVVGNLDEITGRLPEDPELRTRHRAALDAALRGADVTRSLLAVARRQPLNVDCHDLSTLLAEMMPLLRASTGSDITLLSELAAEALWARLDANGLSNVVLNLVINARDALKGAAGDKRVVLRTGEETVGADGADLAAGRYAVLTVSDNGSGMNEAVRAQAFDPFFTTKDRGQGTGLGLAMVRGFVMQLGGSARIESAPGQGTTVRIYLPLDPDRAAASAALEAQRLEALRQYQILDSPAEAEFDTLVAQAAEACGAPIALVSLVDEERQWFKAKIGLQTGQTPRSQAFCAHAIARPGEMLVVPDASIDARFSANPLVTGDPHIRFYAGVPLLDSVGQALGTLCVIDREPRVLAAVQRTRLEELAAQVSAHIQKRAQPLAAALSPASVPALTAIPVAKDPAPAASVLVVDDEEALCELACLWLESMGYRATAVTSAVTALERLELEPFDVLFTDMVMPGKMDGMTLAHKALALRPGLRVIITSGYAQRLIDEPNPPGQLLPKPYRKKDLERILLLPESTGGFHRRP